LEKRNLTDLYFVLYSLLIGVLAAIGALFFRSLIDFFQGLFWASGHTYLQKLINSPWWLKVLVPAAGGLVAGPVITFWVPEAKGPGVPEVISSIAIRQSIMRHRVTVLKAFVTSLLIGCGASVGREGPIVQIGASIGSSLAQLFKLTPEMRRFCLAAGAAAGIAATFNAPIAGTLFAVEIILMDIQVTYLSHIMISSIVASVLSTVFWGKFLTFHVTAFEWGHYWEFIVYLVIGVLAGLVAIVFVRLIYSTDELFRAIPVPEWIKPAIGGLLLGLLAIEVPNVMGVGYETIEMALKSSLTLQLAVLVLVAKIVATALSIGSGMSGGILAPSLVLGSSLGTAVCLAFANFLPALSFRTVDFALAGMGAVVAGTTLAPMTAILTIFELTYSYEILLPLMLTCITSTLIVKLLFGYSAYEMKLIKQGISIQRGHAINVLRSLLVKNFMEKDFQTLQESMPLSGIVQTIMKSTSKHPHFIVVNDDSELTGILSLSDLKEQLGKLDVSRDTLYAADLMTRKVVAIDADSNLEQAFNIFDKSGASCLPVLMTAESKRVVGILYKDDLFKIYHQRIIDTHTLSSS
jgi:CIC family chloride channel protein